MTRVLIAASGTGGHLLPARYIASEILKVQPNTEVVFVGSGRPLEAEIIDKAGFKREVIPLVGIKNKGIFGLLPFFCLVPTAICKTLKLLVSYKPDVVLGVGGYVSVMPVMLGRFFGARCWIHEAEMNPGWANKFLSFFCTGATHAFVNTSFPAKVRKFHTGQPLRPELVSLIRSRSPSIPPKRLLVLGGSQGASSLDNMLLKILPVLKETGFEVWHQARQENLKLLQQKYQEHGIIARVDTFIENMIEAYSFADLIIGRAGASTVHEISLLNIPAIFVPLALGAHNEQALNAQILTKIGKALIVAQGDNDGLQRALLTVVEPVKFQNMLDGGSLGNNENSSAANKIARLVLGVKEAL